MWFCPCLKRKLTVAGGRKRKKREKRKEKKRRPYRRRWVQDESSRNFAAMPILKLVRKSVRYKKLGKKNKKKTSYSTL